LKNLKTLREKVGLTQKQVADKLGITQPTVAIWEMEGSAPRIDKLPKLAKILGCSIDDLFNAAG